MKKILIQTNGEGFYQVDPIIEKTISQMGKTWQDGLLCLFIPHSSCALAINESFDPSAKRDMEKFLQHLAPRNLSFIEHTAEGPDDSPSHMKSILLQTSLTLIIEQGKMQMGTWQGIYLCEFREAPKQRNLWLKFLGGQH